MARMKRARLAGIEVLAEFRMRLAFVDDEVYTVDFKPLLDESPGLARLRDPEVFATATLIEGEGWAVEWPEPDIQIGADTLWLDAQAQNAPDENTCVFVQARGLTEQAGHHRAPIQVASNAFSTSSRVSVGTKVSMKPKA